MITITTVLKTSDRYNSHWVDIMRVSLERNMRCDYVFCPLSDREHTYNHIRLTQDNPGFWNKVELFRPGIFDTPVLFLDLDTVITGDLTPIVEACRGSEFLMFRSRVTKKTPVARSASPVMYWEQDMSFLWNKWLERPQKEWRKIYAGGSLGDQAFISEHAEHELIQDKVPDSSEYFCTSKDTVSSETRLIVLGGPSKKPDSLDWPIVKENWRL